MENLTHEQQFILTSMYKEVLSRQPALSFDEANYFVDSDEVKELFAPNESSYHISTLCWKLKSAGYIHCTKGNDLANNIELTDQTIIYMENRFGSTIKEAANAIFSFINLIK